MQNEIKIEYFKTPYGELILGSFENKLCIADWRYRKMRTAIDNRIQKGLRADFIDGSSGIMDETKVQLNQKPVKVVLKSSLFKQG
ncbi:MAG: hypothetical protein PF484_10705 [Bacteroidales bacterium]|jgi:methylated-DNA-[protein]-cysteine S-methyltransferase|nr:hypothetical protein [Bacteroidales bacterium]